MKIEWNRISGRIGFWSVVLGAAVIISTAVLRQVPGMHRRISALFIGAEYLGTEGVILQTRRNDCGPAALAMLLHEAGKRSSKDEILSAIAMTEHGTTMYELEQYAASKGITVDGWRLNLQELAARKFPALLFVKHDHFITADSICGGEIFYRDPAVGRLKMPLERFNKIWNGYALVMKD